MLHRLLFLLCFPILCLRGDAPESSSNNHLGPIPEWVKPCDFALEAPLKPSQEHIQNLLTDVQRNWENKTTFIHGVVKIINQVIIESLSQLRFSFDPTYQQVIVHQIRVFRNGQWNDRIMTSRHNLIQREEELDLQLFSGNFTHVYFLNDIRVGDILEYSLSSIGENPVFSSHLTDIQFLQSTVAEEKSYYRLLIHPDRSFAIKPCNTSIEPSITDLSPTLREYVWEATETLPSSDDDAQPDWYVSEAHIQISQYATWKELIQQLIPLFSLPKDFVENPSAEMLTLVKKWTESTDDITKRATLALRFVQDEIRYMGFEEGIGGIKPRDPRLILERRFGDCKDKSVLLRTLLFLMEIPSHPVLVHASKGKRLPELLPTPAAFNHAVLQIKIDESLYYVDPTNSLQGGVLQDNYFPPYDWGLVISEESNGLIPLPEAPAKILTEIDTAINITSPSSGEVTTQRTFYGSDADMYRKLIKSIGWKKIKEGLLNDAQERYKGATAISAPVITDDREKNILTTQEVYKIPIRKRAGKQNLKVYSSIIVNELDNDINLERSSPFALIYPEWAKEHIHIQNPFNTWATDSENVTHENESVLYHFSMKKQGQTADFDIELRHLKDHVPLNAVQDYWNIMHEITPNPSLDLIIAVPEAKQE